MRENLKTLLGIACLLVVGANANAQMILTGCTAFLSSNPQPSSLVDINPLTGLASNTRNIGISVMGGIAYQPSNSTLYGLTTFASNPSSSLVAINANTGSFTLIGSTGLPNIVEGDLAINPTNGQLYGIQDFGASFNQRNLFQINPATGSATVIGNIIVAGECSAMAFNTVGELYVIDTGSGGVGNSRLLKIDPNNASILTNITMNVNLGGAAGFTFDPISGAAFVADGSDDGSGGLYQLSTISGDLTFIGSTGAIGGIAGLTIIGVPEPSSILLAISAGIGLVVEKLRKTKNGT